MNPIYRIIAKRTLLLGVPAAAVWAGRRRLQGRPLTLNIRDAGLFAAAMSAYFATVFVGSVRLGYPGLMTRIAPALGWGCIALTFDDGPCPETTPRILDALRAAGAQATFFVLLEQVARHPELARRIVDEGHTLGVHGVDHEPMVLLSIRQVVHALKMMQRELGPDLPQMRYFRPPHGFKSANILEAVKRMGMTAVTWSVNPKDYLDAAPDALVRRVVATASNGDIVLLHDCRSNTAEALPAIIERLKRRGFRLVRL